jgi:serine/threonine-protein kinase
LVHRDVKPSNILLEDTVERAVLTDFGLARAMDDASLTQTGIIAGTPHYMSPEQATGDEIDPRSDLFSLGAVLYFMATGHPPFRAANALAVLHRICQSKHRLVWQANKNLPDGLCDIIDRLLEKKPGRRFASAEEVREKLAALLSQVQQHGFGRLSRGGSQKRRHRRRMLATLAVVSCTLLSIGIVWFAEGQGAGKSGISTQPEVGTAIATENTEFAASLNEAKTTLDQAERETFFIRGGDEAWNREIESLQQELDKIETTNHQQP